MAEADWREDYAKAVKDAKKWRDDLEDPDWREDILEDEDLADAAWVRVYTIYETKDPQKAEIVLGNCGAADPTLYNGAGFVDIEYHFNMNPFDLWNAFQEHVLLNVIPSPDSDVDDETCKELWKVFENALGADNNSNTLMFHEIAKDHMEDPLAVPDVDKKWPGIISDFSSAKRGDLKNPYGTNDTINVCLDLFGWEDHDDINKCVALIRGGHFVDDSDADLANSRIVEPIYRLESKPDHHRNCNDWVNVIGLPDGPYSKGKWEAKVISKAGEIVRDKTAGGRGRRGCV